MEGATDEEISCFHMINHTIKSHKQLSVDDIKFASNYICSLYYYSKTLDEDPFDEDKLLLFLTYTQQKGMCRFALLYNTNLDKIIITRDKTKLKELLFTFSENNFVELYDNPFLSQENKDSIERLIVREFFTNKIVLDFVREKLLNAELIDDSCSIEQESSSQDLIQIARQCYENVCVQDSKMLGNSEVDSILTKHDCSPNKVYTVDGIEDPMIYCFDILQLFDIILSKKQINPFTGKQFSEYSLKLIFRRFEKEINLYRRYKELKK
jgi:hypothetical protein